MNGGLVGERLPHRMSTLCHARVEGRTCTPQFGLSDIINEESTSRVIRDAVTEDVSNLIFVVDVSNASSTPQHTAAGRTH